MRALGISFAKISEQLKISKPTLIQWGKDFELDIQNMRTIEQEALHEKYLITKEKRIEMLGESLDKVKQEIAKRDLSTIPTEKVVKYDLKEPFLTLLNRNADSVVSSCRGAEIRTRSKWSQTTRATVDTTPRFRQPRTDLGGQARFLSAVTTIF